MSKREKLDSEVQDKNAEETPRTMLMKLRSYPDTIESKQRKIGIYKSPAAPSVRNSKLIASRRKSSVGRKASMGKSKGSPKTTPPIIKSIKELKAATMELNEVTPQYPPSHHPVVTPKSEKLSVTKYKKLKEASPQIMSQSDSGGMNYESMESGNLTGQVNRTKSSLRSFTKSRDVSGRRVSFGPVHEYHPDDHKPLDDVNEYETIQNSLDTVGEGLSDESLIHKGFDDVAIPTFDQFKSKSPLLQTPPLLLSRSPQRSYKTRNHSRNLKRGKPTIPTSFTKKQFCLFAKKKLTKEAAEVLVKNADDFIEYISKELEIYALHAKRKTINLSDVILLMKREKYLTGNETLSSLANKYMCDEHVSEIIPCVEVLSMKPSST